MELRDLSKEPVEGKELKELRPGVIEAVNEYPGTNFRAANLTEDHTRYSSNFIGDNLTVMNRVNALERKNSDSERSNLYERVDKWPEIHPELIDLAKDVLFVRAVEVLEELESPEDAVSTIGEYKLSRGKLNGFKGNDVQATFDYYNQLNLLDGDELIGDMSDIGYIESRSGELQEIAESQGIPEEYRRIIEEVNSWFDK